VVKARSDSSDQFTREKLESTLFELSRKLLTADVVLRRILSRTHGDLDGQGIRFIVNLLSSGLQEIIAVSRLPKSPLGEITPANLREYDSLALHQFLNSHPQDAPQSSASRLSRRERQVVKFLAEGKSNKEIAAALGLTLSTVETYRARVMMKLNGHSLSDVFRFAVSHRLIEIPLL